MSIKEASLALYKEYNKTIDNIFDASTIDCSCKVSLFVDVRNDSCSRSCCLVKDRKLFLSNN